MPVHLTITLVFKIYKYFKKEVFFTTGISAADGTASTAVEPRSKISAKSGHNDDPSLLASSDNDDSELDLLADDSDSSSQDTAEEDAESDDESLVADAALAPESAVPVSLLAC